MGTEYVKEWLSKETNTSPKDWKRISKRNIYRQFRNIKDDSTIIVGGDRDPSNVGYEDSDIFIYYNELIPDGFLIILPDSVKKENITYNMILPNTDEALWGDQDGISLVFTNSKLTDSGLDQHIGYFIENWFGVKNFRKDFDEVSENDLRLITKLSIKEVIDKLEAVGLKFEGFDNLYDWI